MQHDTTSSAMRMRKTSIAFVILTWQSQPFIRDCLESVCALHTAFDVSVFIFDNGSKDQTLAIVQDISDQYKETVPFVIEKSKKNIGTTRSRNVLLKQVPDDIDYVCVLDSDTVIDAKPIQLMIEALKADENALIAAPRMFNKKGIEQRSVKRFPTIKIKCLKASPRKSSNKRGEALESYPFMPDPTMTEITQDRSKRIKYAKGRRPAVVDDQRIHAADYAISACWLMKKETLNLIGYLDECIYYAPEDVEYCARIRKSGYKVILVSSASIYHFTQRISKRRFFSVVNVRHLFGLVYYFIKHGHLSK